MKVVVRQWESVLVYKDGLFERELVAGRHRLPARRRELVCTDLRARLVTVPAQELLTLDGLGVRVTLLAQVRIADARRATEAVENGDAVLYAALQVALRGRVAARTVDEVLADRDALGAELALDVTRAADAVGRVLDAVAVRDVMVPGELRTAALRVLTAKQEGLAALERARGETAALRSLANAARLAQDVPALLALRTLRAVETGGATVVLRQD